MNTIRKLKSVFLGIILTTTLLINASNNPAQADFQEQVYSPDRPGIPFAENMPGLPYQSFNNFTGNPNMGPAYSSDERYFTVSKWCQDANCGGYYANTPTNDENAANIHYFQEGQKVRFQIYFHNNGEDKYDDVNDGPADATNVQIGVELDDILDSTYDNILRPRGFIYANNNSYKNQAGATITSVGATVRKALDDTQIRLNELGLSLEPVPGSAKVKFKNVNGFSGNHAFDITEATSITFDTAQPAQTVTVTPVFQDDKIYLQFNKLPGCFRYSGFAYFDAIITKNYCESLTGDKENTGVQKNGEDLYRLFKTGVTFSETGATIPYPEDTRYKWISDDGKFYTSLNDNTPTEDFILTTLDHPEIYYTGHSPVNLILTRLNNAGEELAPMPDYLKPNTCQVAFTFPATCTNLPVTHTNNSTDNLLATINNQLVTVHKFNYNAPGITYSAGNPPQNVKLKWTSDSPAGRFYTKFGNNYVAAGGNTNSYTTANATAPQTVYYVGTGTVSVKPVNSDGSNNPNLNVAPCIKSFTVTNEDITYCTGGITNTPVTSQYVTINGNQVYMHTLSPNAVPTYSAGALPFPVGLKWTTSNANGTFYKKPAANYVAQANHQAVGSLNTTMYYSGTANDTITVRLIKTNAAHDTEVAPSEAETLQINNQAVCKTTFNIPAEVLTCSDLIVTQTPPGNIFTNSWTTFSAVAKDQHGNPFAGSIRYMVPAANGLFYAVAPPDPNNPPAGGVTSLLKGQGLNAYLHALTIGNNVVTVKLDGANVPAACIKTFSITQEQNNLSCQELILTIRDENNTVINNDDDLSQNVVYEITANAQYNGNPVNPQNRFIAAKGIFGIKANLDILKIAGLTSAEATAQFPNFKNPILVPNNTPIYFLPFTDQTGAQAFHVEAVGFEDICFQSRGLAEIPACQSIQVYLIAPDGSKTPLNSGSDLSAPGIYELQADLLFEPAMDGMVTFTTTQGILSETIVPELTQELEVKENTSVYLNIPDGAPATPNAITVKAASNDPEKICIAHFNITTQLDECTSIVVYPSTLDPSAPTQYQLDPTAGHLGDFTGEFSFSSGCQGSTFTNTNGTITGNQFTYNDFLKGIIYSGGCTKQDHSITISGIGQPESCSVKMDYDYNDTNDHCPNSILEPEKGEECDDGNQNNNDGCDNTCHLDDNPPGGNTPRPKIEKWVRDPNTGSWVEELFYGTIVNKYKTVFYKVVVTPNGKDILRIKESDPIRDTEYNKRIDLQGIAIVEGVKKGKKIELNTICDDNAIISAVGPNKKSFEINTIPTCTKLFNEQNEEDSRIKETPSNFVINNLDNIDYLYVYYKYSNNILLSEAFCDDLTYPDCGIELPNTATLRNKTDSTTYDKDDVKIIILCPYVLTRESGDVFFHDELENINSLEACYQIDDTTGLILRPTDEDTPKYNTGYNPAGHGNQDPFEAPTHDICKMSNTENGDLPEEYQNTLKNFSSSVCEMKADVAEQWKEKFINDAIKANVAKLTRWNIGTFDNSDPAVPSTGIVYTNQELTIGASGAITIAGNPDTSIPAARTYIIQNANLIIENNVTYDDSTAVLTNPKTIPSAAFIVIDGNIQISNNVTDLDGIFVAIDTEGDIDGEIQSKEGTERQEYEMGKTLTIRGSLVGDISNLFKYRRAVGANPYQNQGSIVVKYDERILLNTPPGLTDLLDIAQLRVAH